MAKRRFGKLMPCSSLSDTEKQNNIIEMPPCLTLSIIRYISRVKWVNPGKWLVPFPTPWCSSYWKGSLRVTLDYGRQLIPATVLRWGNSMQPHLESSEIFAIHGILVTAISDNQPPYVSWHLENFLRTGVLLMLPLYPYKCHRMRKQKELYRLQRISLGGMQMSI